MENFDFRKNYACPKRIYIEREAVERVETYKYPGVGFGSKLNTDQYTHDKIKRKKKKKKMSANCREGEGGRFGVSWGGGGTSPGHGVWGTRLKCQAGDVSTASSIPRGTF